MSNAQNILPIESDDAATAHSWSDSHAATIIKRTPKTITVQFDTAKLLNGSDSGEPDALKFERGGFLGHTSGQQRYEYTRDENGRTRTYSLRKNGRWIEKGAPANSRGCSLTLGKRHHHYDFNF